MTDGKAANPDQGHLPMAVFQHMEPTGVGTVDLDRAAAPSPPYGRDWEPNQLDALLLVRLHGDPLAIVHIDRNLAGVRSSDLAAELWLSVEAEVRRHVERCGCIRVPDTRDALLAEVQSLGAVCRGSQPTIPNASAAVIICTTGQEERLGRCLHSLLAQNQSEFEIVVVDNRPETGKARRTVSPIAATDARVRYVEEPRVGLSVARNRGVYETDADLVAFTDDDVVVDPAWLEWLIAPFAEPAVTATSGMVLPLELGTEAQKRFEQYGGFSKGMERRAFDMRTGRPTAGLLYPFLGDVFGGGNSMAFRRRELVDAGGFDPALGAGSPTGGGEDIYALSTAILHGGRVVYEPRALCWHEHRPDGNSLQSQIFNYGVGLGAIITKALSSDRRFYAAAARSVPIVFRHLHVSDSEHETPTDDGALSRKELLRSHRKGILYGPLRYAEGVLRAHRQGVRDVIRGG